MVDLLALFQCSLLKRETVSDILAVNGTTAQAGLVFSPGQAVTLLKARGQALHDSGRLELKGGIVKKLILAFYDSPFFLREQAVDMLEALMEVFYHLKNETFDSLGDDELIGFLRERFDGECQGSLERLRDEAFDGLARKIHGAAREEDGSRENDRGGKRMNDLARTGGAMLLSAHDADGAGQRLLWLNLLEKQIERYTHGDSSSVPLETAGSLLRSFLYTAVLAQDGIIQKGKQPEALLREGRDILSRQVKKARRLFYLVHSTMLIQDAPCYREAIEAGIPGFFCAYDMEFAAHETPGDFDYPVSIPCTHTGITWMLHYLDTLYWENVFCRRFPQKEVEGTLKAHGIWGAVIPVNIFGPVFAAALHGYLLNRGHTASLAIHAPDNRQLVQLMAPFPSEAIMSRVREVSERMMEDMEIRSGPFRTLLMCQADELARRLVPALMHGDVSGIFPPWFSPPSSVPMMDGDPMEDGDFRALAAELAACRYFSDKLLLVRRRVHSLHDMTGLMDCGCFLDREMRRLFSLLNKAELAALLRMGRGGIILQGRWVFPGEGEIPDDAPLWEECLYRYLSGIESKQRSEIIDLAGQAQLAT